ncbi:hypothetical protein PIB30_047610 [Stylosanthes scabra]|uniref:Uncharacterized protein n=1 Tax=Stylosanthes scabra TaxID=79078 RepID=A0ABU6QG92_9FABA|nr:hypothetical protein [Stylosanthes scabra]
MPDPYVIVSEPAPAPPPQDRTVADPDADDEGAPRGRGRRVIRRRDCGTGATCRDLNASRRANTRQQMQ